MNKTNLESNVRYYSRKFPDVWASAKNATLISESGKSFIDFFAGAGSLNYGHNNQYIKQKMISYMQSDNIIQGLDLLTPAKRDFIDSFKQYILDKRQMDYKLQFTGPTGANAVEAALKLCCKIKQNASVYALTNSFHGMTAGALSVSACLRNQNLISSNLEVSFIPTQYDHIARFDPIRYLQAVLSEKRTGFHKPAAIIIEAVQAEGGVYPLSDEFLRGLYTICKEQDIILICDEIQVGCYRTGSFFSFESSGIEPDMIVLSKSISGYGLPMSLVLMKPELDLWIPGEHTGTFRGNQLAFVGAKAALEYAETAGLGNKVNEDSAFVQQYLEESILPLGLNLSLRNKGMIYGIDFSECSITAGQVAEECYRNGLIIETAGKRESVLKILPPLTIERELLCRGIDIIVNAVKSSMGRIPAC